MPTHPFLMTTAFALFLLTCIALAGFGKQTTPTLSLKGDRLDLVEKTGPCRGTLIATACAGDEDAARAFHSNKATIQVYEKAGETILVRTKIGD